jgi:hypothetical protein
VALKVFPWGRGSAGWGSVRRGCRGAGGVGGSALVLAAASVPGGAAGDECGAAGPQAPARGRLSARRAAFLVLVERVRGGG